MHKLLKVECNYAVIIKNRYLLLLIIRIFNYFNELKYFIKLNLKNVYYYIYINIINLHL